MEHEMKPKISIFGGREKYLLEEYVCYRVRMNFYVLIKSLWWSHILCVEKWEIW